MISTACLIDVVYPKQTGPGQGWKCSELWDLWWLLKESKPNTKTRNVQGGQQKGLTTVIRSSSVLISLILETDVNIIFDLFLGEIYKERI